MKQKELSTSPSAIYQRERYQKLKAKKTGSKRKYSRKEAIIGTDIELTSARDMEILRHGMKLGLAFRELIN